MRISSAKKRWSVSTTISNSNASSISTGQSSNVGLTTLEKGASVFLNAFVCYRLSSWIYCYDDNRFKKRTYLFCLQIALQREIGLCKVSHSEFDYSALPIIKQRASLLHRLNKTTIKYFVRKDINQDGEFRKLTR